MPVQGSASVRAGLSSPLRWIPTHADESPGAKAEITVSVADQARSLRRRILTSLAASGIATTAEPTDADIEVVPMSSATREEIDAPPAAGGSLRIAVVAERPRPRAVQALGARFEGIVLGAELERALQPTVLAVLAGQCVLPRTLSRIADIPPLSPREKQILAMVVLRLSNAEIAEQLVVTESTVKGHLSSAFSKLGVKSRTEAAQKLMDQETGLGLGVLRISPEEEG